MQNFYVIFFTGNNFFFTLFVKNNIVIQYKLCMKFKKKISLGVSDGGYQVVLLKKNL